VHGVEDLFALNVYVHAALLAVVLQPGRDIAEAEAAGIDKKAEAMQKYGEAAIIEMLCKMYPLVAEAIAKPLANIDSITMYGEGNTAKMTEDITKSFKQTIDGIGDSLGIDLSSVIGSFAGTKLAGAPGLGLKADAKTNNAEG
jgi:flotillin